MKSFFLFGLLFITNLNFSQNINVKVLKTKELDTIWFSYSLLAKDILKCKYFDLTKSKLQYSKVVDSSFHGVITEQKFLLDDSLKMYYYKHNFANSTAQVRNRDAVEIHGLKFNIDSLYYDKKFNRRMPYIYSSLINVGNFNFNSQSYIAFFIQDLSNPMTLPNTMILLFNITDDKNIFCIPVDFQSSEDLKCFNDFDNDGVLDYACWRHGYDYQKKMYRYKLSRSKKFIIQKNDFVVIDENPSGYLINPEMSHWPYWQIKNNK